MHRRIGDTSCETNDRCWKDGETCSSYTRREIGFAVGGNLLEKEAIKTLRREGMCADSNSKYDDNGNTAK